MQPRVLTTGVHPEGPTWSSDGTLYITDSGNITAISPDGSKRRFAETKGAGGTGWGPGGYLYVVGGKTVKRVDPQGKVEILYDNYEGKPFLGTNDMVIDAYGGIYFTDPGPVSRDGLVFGHVYYALCDGSKITRLQYYFYYCNGIGITPDGKTLMVDESMTSRVFAIPILSPGVLAQVEAGARAQANRNWPVTSLFGTIPAPAVCDGMCFDEAGNLFVAAHGSGMIAVFAPDGSPRKPIQCEDRGVTNCCFGGPDFRTLYITESDMGRVSMVEWERPGLRPNYQK